MSITSAMTEDLISEFFGSPSEMQARAHERLVRELNDLGDAIPAEMYEKIKDMLDRFEQLDNNEIAQIAYELDLPLNAVYVPSKAVDFAAYKRISPVLAEHGYSVLAQSGEAPDELKACKILFTMMARDFRSTAMPDAALKG